MIHLVSFKKGKIDRMNNSISGSSQEEKELTGVAKKSLETVDAFITV